MYKDAIGLSCGLAEIMKEYDDPRIEAILTEAIGKLKRYRQEDPLTLSVELFEIQKEYEDPRINEILNEAITQLERYASQQEFEANVKYGCTTEMYKKQQLVQYQIDKALETPWVGTK